MKRSYWIVGSIGLSLLFLGVIINFFLTFGASRSANRFLNELCEGRNTVAYGMTTRDYQQKTSAKEFARLARRWNLRNFTHTEGWEDQSGNGQVTISANLRTASGDFIPLMMKLLKEDGNWRVDDLKGPPPPAPRYVLTKGFGHFRRHRRSEEGAPSDAPAVPTAEEVDALLKTSLLDLARALETGDYKSFRSTVSQEWQDESPAVVFDRVLSRIDREKLDLPAITQNQPVRIPVVQRDSRIEVRGKYLTGEQALDFHLNYAHEADGWKLSSFWIGLRELLPEELPDESEAAS
jgi:hypothetical protein